HSSTGRERGIDVERADASPDEAGAADASPPDEGGADSGQGDAGSGQQPATAKITGGSWTGRAPLTVFLDATTSRSPNPGGWITKFHWDLGDGTTSSNSWLYKSYANAGEYHVVLQSFDNGGRVSSVE